MSRDRGPVGRFAAGLGRVLIGPWPLYPRAIAVLIAYGLLIRAFVRSLSQGVDGKPWTDLILPNVVTIVIVAAIAWGGAIVLPRLLAPRGAARYIAVIVLETLLITVALVAMVRLLLPDGHTPVQAGVAPVAALSALMILITVAFANGVAGFVLERFRREEELVRLERTMQLAAEERVRGETARFLHDDVQTALLRASLRLVPLAETLSDPKDQDALRATIAEIDTVRKESVRSVGRLLSPPLSSTGLIVALTDLAASYEGVMVVDIEIDTTAAERFRIVGEEDRVALATYRLTEQALQNALKHGHAAWARVALSLHDGDSLELIVEADGAAPSGTRISGNGTAIINAWLDDVGGAWSLAAGESGGSRFHARIAPTD